MSANDHSEYNPGSNEAIAAGCTCPVLDNAHGTGYLGGAKDKDGNVMFVMSLSCQLHGRTSLRDEAQGKPQ